MTFAIIVGPTNMFRWNFFWTLALLTALTQVGCRRGFDCSTLGTPGRTAFAIQEMHLQGPAHGSYVRIRLVAPERPTRATRLVLLTTGLGAELTDFDPLAQTLAASDYAVAVIQHRVSQREHVCGTTTGAECWNKLQDTETHPENWFERFSDVRQAMDQLPTLLGIDGGHVALVGHSFGAFTAMGLGGTTFVDPRTNTRQDLRDPRVVAVVAMSPQGPRWFGLDEDSWKSIDRPLLLLTGDRDGSTMVDDSPEWRRASFATMSGGDKLMLRIADGDHMSFTAHAKRADVAELVRRITLAFLDDTVRAGKKGASLSAEAVAQCSRGQASLERH